MPRNIFRDKDKYSLYKHTIEMKTKPVMTTFLKGKDFFLEKTKQ